MNWKYRSLVNSQFWKVYATNFMSSNNCVNLKVPLPGKSGSNGNEKWILVIATYKTNRDCLLGGDLLA